MTADPMPPDDVGVRVEAVAPADAGELLTVQRAAFASEARIYGDPELPALIQTWTTCGPSWAPWRRSRPWPVTASSAPYAAG